MSAQAKGKAKDGLERILVLEIARVTEAAAVAAARLRGRGNEKAADKAAVDSMRRELGRVNIDGTVVIGEGEMDEAPMLYIGEKVGTATARQSISPSIHSRATSVRRRCRIAPCSPSPSAAACCMRPTCT
jgi:hypothetical protein